MQFIQNKENYHFSNCIKNNKFESKHLQSKLTNHEMMNLHFKLLNNGKSMESSTKKYNIFQI